MFSLGRSQGGHRRFARTPVVAVVGYRLQYMLHSADRTTTSGVRVLCPDRGVEINRGHGRTKTDQFQISLPDTSVKPSQGAVRFYRAISLI